MGVGEDEDRFRLAVKEVRIRSDITNADIAEMISEFLRIPQEDMGVGKETYGLKDDVRHQFLARRS